MHDVILDDNITIQLIYFVFLVLTYFTAVSGTSLINDNIQTALEQYEV